MSVDKKILEEISKYNNINKYIREQETDLPEPIEGAPQWTRRCAWHGATMGATHASSRVFVLVC